MAGAAHLSPQPAHRRRLTAGVALLLAVPALAATAHRAAAVPALQAGYQVVSAAAPGTFWSADAYVGSATAQTTPGQAFADGPLAPPYGFGSRQATLGATDAAGTDVSGTQTELWRTSALNTVPLSSITGLRFSTFTSNLDATSTRTSIKPFTVRLSVDRDGDSVPDTQLTYVHRASQAFALGAWQTWTVDPASDSFLVDQTTATTTLAAFTAANPSAKVQDNRVAQQNRDTGTAFVAGGAGTLTNRSVQSVDGLLVTFAASAGNVLYDFEGTRTTATAPVTVANTKYIDPVYAPSAASPFLWVRRTAAADGTETTTGTGAGTFVPGPPVTATGVPPAPAGPPFRSAGNPLPGSVVIQPNADPTMTEVYRGNPILGYAGAIGQQSLPMNQLAQLRYATYVPKSASTTGTAVTRQPATLTVLVAPTGSTADPSTFQRLTFTPSANATTVPGVNGPVAEGVWQQWEVVGGAVTALAATSGATPVATTWNGFLAANPDARLVATTTSSPFDPAGGTVAFSVSGLAAGAPTDQPVYVDGFRVSIRATYNAPNGLYVQLTQDFEPVPLLAITGSTVVENGSSNGTADAAFRIRPVRALNQPVSVTYQTADGTAKAPADYTAVPTTTGTIPAGAAGATNGIAVPLTYSGNDIAEADKTVQLTAGSTDAPAKTAGVANAGTVVIRDDDAPTISLGDTSLPEKAGRAVLPVTLTRAAAADVSLTYATLDGSATSPADYAASTGTLVVPRGATTASVSVPVTHQAGRQPTRTFSVRLFDPVGPASVAKAEGVVTLTDDDPLPVVVPPVPPVPPVPSYGLTLASSATTVALDGTVTYTGTASTDGTGTAGAPVSFSELYTDGKAVPLGETLAGPGGAFRFSFQGLYGGTVTATSRGASASLPLRVLVSFASVKAVAAKGVTTVTATVAPGFITGPNRTLRAQLLILNPDGSTRRVVDLKGSGPRKGLKGFPHGVNVVVLSSRVVRPGDLLAVKVLGTPANTGATSASLVAPGTTARAV